MPQQDPLCAGCVPPWNIAFVQQHAAVVGRGKYAQGPRPSGLALPRMKWSRENLGSSRRVLRWVGNRKPDHARGSQGPI